MNLTEQRTAIARAIWNIRREDEDRCDIELEDLGRDHSVWRETDAAIAAIPKPDTVASDEVLREMNDALCWFGNRWIMDGDYLRCRKCKRPHIASKADVTFVHAEDCKAIDPVPYPWRTLMQILAPLYTEAPIAPPASEQKPFGYYYEINGTWGAFIIGKNEPPDDAYDAGSLMALYTAPQPDYKAQRDALLKASERLLKAHRLTVSRPPETVMQAENQLAEIRSAVAEAEAAIASVKGGA